jgi:hypothetical protein
VTGVPWIGFGFGIAVLVGLLLLLDHWFERRERDRRAERSREVHGRTGGGVGVARRAGLVTVVGLVSAGAVLGLAKLLQVDAEASDDWAEDDW